MERKTQLNELIGLKATGSASYEIYYKTKLIGNAILDVDGSYYFCANGINGYWNEYSLRLIADTLAWLNEPWEIKIKQAFENDY